MKKIKFLLTFLFLATIMVSCDTDGGTSELDLMEGAVSNIQKNDASPAFLNLNELNAGNDVEITFDVDIKYGDVSSVDVLAFYKGQDTVYGPATLRAGVTDFPVQMSVSDADIIAAFDHLSSKADFELADEVILTTRLYLSDGRVIELLGEGGSRNYGSDIHTSSFYNAQVSYPVSCPSDLAGTYDVVSNGSSTDPDTPEDAVNLPYTVTITADGGGSYTISDGVAGVYIFWYSKYGYTFETPGTFTDICGTLTGSWVERFGCPIDLTGTVNPDGTLSIQWSNCFGDEATAVYTPQ